MAPNAKSIDAYLAPLNPDQRAALKKIRRAIKAAAPRAVECISYGIPAFKLDGRMLVGFGARASHCSFYPWDGGTVVKFKAELQGYDTSPGTIRFRADQPLPATLVGKLVKWRIAANAARDKK